MKKAWAKILSVCIVIAMLITIVPIGSITANASSVTLEQLQSKYPHGKYWNHVGSSSNNENGYTSTPCPSHSSVNTCNAYTYNGTELGWQCYGFALKLGYDIYGTNPRNWQRAYSLNNIKPGDIINYDGNNPGHTVFVIAVNGNTISFAECNYGGRCIIRWDRSLQKSEFNDLYNVYVAPYAWDGGTVGCNCSTSYAGNYTCTTSSVSLTIRSGHGTSYSAIGSIPSGETVYVSKADGTWAHVTYNGISGYASMEYLKISHNHSYSSSITKSPACTTTGTRTYKCSCGSSYTESIAALGHDYSGEKVQEPNHPHVVTQRCVRYSACGAYYVTGENGYSPDCSQCGKPGIRWWLADSEYGDTPSEYKVGNRYWLCYQLIDQISGKNWDDVADNNYTITISVYNPDGTLNYSNDGRKDDEGWISIFYKVPGIYTRKITITGDFNFTDTETFTVNKDPETIHADVSSVNLILGGVDSKTFYVWTSGYHTDKTVISWSSNNANISGSWGEWTSDGKCPLTITGKKRGSATITLSVKEKETDKVLHSILIPVSISAKTYTVQYNANGGSGAPGSQKKYYGEPLYCSSTVPIRTGYIFKGWATTSTATIVSYQPGAKYTSNSGGTLYAVWEKIKVESVRVEQLPQKKTYTQGESFDSTGLKLQVTYNDNTTKTITSGFTVTGYNSSKLGEQSVYVTYEGKQTKFVVTVVSSLKITAQPKTVYVKEGALAQTTVKATGDGLTYTWYVCDEGDKAFKKSGIANATYSMNVTRGKSNRQLYCVITDKYGNKVQTNTVYLRAKVAITAQPKTAYAAVGTAVETAVKVSGDGVKYTWYIKDVGDKKYYKSSVTSATYTYKMTAEKSDRRAYCVVTDKYGNTVQTNTVCLRSKAAITTQPKTAYAKLNATATVSVKATGDGLKYVWYVKNANGSKYSKSSITKSTYSVKMTSKVNGRRLICYVYDKYGNKVQSNTVILKKK